MYDQERNSGIVKWLIIRATVVWPPLRQLRAPVATARRNGSIRFRTDDDVAVKPVLPIHTSARAVGIARVERGVQRGDEQRDIVVLPAAGGGAGDHGVRVVGGRRRAAHHAGPADGTCRVPVGHARRRIPLSRPARRRLRHRQVPSTAPPPPRRPRRLRPTPLRARLRSHRRRWLLLLLRHVPPLQLPHRAGSGGRR